MIIVSVENRTLNVDYRVFKKSAVHSLQYDEAQMTVDYETVD